MIVGRGLVGAASGVASPSSRTLVSVALGGSSCGFRRGQLCSTARCVAAELLDSAIPGGLFHSLEVLYTVFIFKCNLVTSVRDPKDALIYLNCVLKLPLNLSLAHVPEFLLLLLESFEFQFLKGSTCH